VWGRVVEATVYGRCDPAGAQDIADTAMALASFLHARGDRRCVSLMPLRGERGGCARQIRQLQMGNVGVFLGAG
jgi:hypothetical protein